MAAKQDYREAQELVPTGHARACQAVIGIGVLRAERTNAPYQMPP